MNYLTTKELNAIATKARCSGYWDNTDLGKLWMKLAIACEDVYFALLKEKEKDMEIEKKEQK